MVVRFTDLLELPRARTNIFGPSLTPYEWDRELVLPNKHLALDRSGARPSALQKSPIDGATSSD